MTQIPVINMVATGQNITRLRKQAGLSVANLQQIFGFTTPQAIYKWQRGTALPTVGCIQHQYQQYISYFIIYRSCRILLTASEIYEVVSVTAARQFVALLARVRLPYFLPP